MPLLGVASHVVANHAGVACGQPHRCYMSSPTTQGDSKQGVRARAMHEGMMRRTRTRVPSVRRRAVL
eukprot:2017534-Alexandrium_andersonii.AAC.1